jgi:outer membrane protein
MRARGPTLHLLTVLALANGVGCASSSALSRVAAPPVLDEAPAAPRASGSKRADALNPARPQATSSVAAASVAGHVKQAGLRQSNPDSNQGAPEAAMPEALPLPAPSDLTLEEAIQLTLTANPDLQAALLRTQIAEQALANARAQFFPYLASNTEYQDSNNPLRKFSFLLNQGVVTPHTLFPLPAASADIFHTQIHFRQDIYTGGLRTAQIRAADADHDASVFSLAAVRNLLGYQVAEAYYHVIQARELVDVRRENVAEVESELKVARSRFAANTVVQSDVLSVEVRLARAKEALSTSNSAVELAMAILENAMGLPLQDRSLPKELPRAPWPEEFEQVEAYLAQATANRAELYESANRRLAAEHRVQAAQSAKRPTLGLVTDYDLYAGQERSLSSYFVGLALSLNLFDGGRTRTSVRQAEAQVLEISKRHQRLLMDIELEVRKALLELKDARERLKSAASTLARARANLRDVESRYREQTATTTELLDAEVLLSEERVRSTNAAADVEIARVGVQRSIGRLSDLLTSGCEQRPH